MNLNDALTYYSNLLILQYRGKPKATATVKLLANQALCDNLPILEQNCWNLNSAAGVQLDILGKIVGVPRKIYGLDMVHTFFSFADYSGGSGVGMGDYTVDPYPSDLFRQYNLDAIYSLSDFEMIVLIKLKIICNCMRTSTKDLTEALYAAFGEDITLTDNKDSTLTYTAKELYTSALTAAQFLKILPKPMGVVVSVSYV
jgi:hypothetical protein